MMSSSAVIAVALVVSLVVPLISVSSVIAVALISTPAVNGRVRRVRQRAESGFNNQPRLYCKKHAILLSRLQLGFSDSVCISFYLDNC